MDKSNHIPTTIDDADTIPMVSVEQFAETLVGWHNVHKARLDHMLRIPESIEVEVDLGDGMGPRNIVLSGEAALGFKAGIITSLSELGTLPFAFSVDTDEDAPTITENGDMVPTVNP